MTGLIAVWSVRSLAAGSQAQPSEAGTTGSRQAEQAPEFAHGCTSMCRHMRVYMGVC